MRNISQSSRARQAVRHLINLSRGTTNVRRYRRYVQNTCMLFFTYTCTRSLEVQNRVYECKLCTHHCGFRHSFIVCSRCTYSQIYWINTGECGEQKTFYGTRKNYETEGKRGKISSCSIAIIDFIDSRTRFYCTWKSKIIGRRHCSWQIEFQMCTERTWASGHWHAVFSR